MSRRLLAGLVALVISLTGTLPAVAGYRCIMTGMRMEAPSACCQHRNEYETPALKAPCCEQFAAPQLEARRTPPSVEIRIHAPAPVSWMVLPLLASIEPASDVLSRAFARGRPPGEQLHLLSSILRV
jgi:hypothetical protein